MSLISFSLACCLITASAKLKRIWMNFKMLVWCRCSGSRRGLQLCCLHVCSSHSGDSAGSSECPHQVAAAHKKQRKKDVVVQMWRLTELHVHASLCISVQFCLPTCWGRCWMFWGSWAACCACWEASFWLSMPQKNRKWRHCRTWPINCLILVGWQHALTVAIGLA